MSRIPEHHWRGPRWAFALLLAGLSMIGPFVIDTYLPAFTGIARSLGATPVQMQQTLSAYLLAFAFANLFHGALADAWGRRPVVLAGLAVFTLASIGCALSATIGQLIAFRALQGLSAGVGMVISRVIVRDLFEPVQAQRMLSQVTIFFGVAPAVAPLVGGVLFDQLGWRSIFWFLALVSLVLMVVNHRWLPETLEPGRAQPFAPLPLLRGYATLLRDARFVTLVLASSIPFNGMFLYVLGAPAFLGEVLGLPPTQFFWFFICTVSGIMGGAWASGRLAGRIASHRQVGAGFALLLGMALTNVVIHLLLPPDVRWSIVPVAIYAFGWSMLTPVVTLMLLDLHPERRGMASSVQASIGSVVNAAVAGVLVPLVMHSALAMALASLTLAVIGWLGWRWVRARLLPAAAAASAGVAAPSSPPPPRR